jgi:hypothetical protein
MRLAVLSVLCLFVSCFQEPPADRVWRCSAEQPGCPQGQSCMNDWCVKDGTATPDLAVSDAGGGGDMSKPPCTDGFRIGSKGAWACRGKFSPATTKASALCKNGFKPCADSALISDAECSANSGLGGFFFADAPGTGNDREVRSHDKCGWGNGSMWFGCGWTITTSYESNQLGLPWLLPGGHVLQRYQSLRPKRWAARRAADGRIRERSPLLPSVGHS